MTSAPQTLVMAIFPNTRGFAYAIFEGSSPIDWGISDAQGHGRNETCLHRISTLLWKYNPDVLLLRDNADVSSDRSGRVCALVRAIADLAATRSQRTVFVSRRQVREAFGYLGHPTRYAIAQAIARRMLFLEPLVPPARKIWNSEDRRMGLFDAVALALTFMDDANGERRG